jgi:hypothetical protein
LGANSKSSIVIGFLPIKQLSLERKGARNASVGSLTATLSLGEKLLSLRKGMEAKSVWTEYLTWLLVCACPYHLNDADALWESYL